MIHRDADARGNAADATAVAVAARRRVRRTSTPGSPNKAEVLQVDGLTVRDAQGVTRLDNFTLTLNRGEIIGVAGVEGNGQSELAAVLSGMVAPTDGRFFVQDRRAHLCEPKGGHGGRRGRGAGRPPRGRLHHRHDGRGEHLPQSPRSLHPLRISSPQRGQCRGARADGAVSTCAPPARRSRFRACPAATSRRPCWRAS